PRVSGHREGAWSVGGGQGPAPRAGCRRQPGALPPRDPPRRPAAAPAHRPAAHGRRRRRSPVLHHAVREGGVAPGATGGAGAARGVVHRDIKPGNVLTQRSHALVTDFGVAKAISAALPSAGATTSGLAIGTPAYMAPEQLAADPAADHRVDLYAVGLLAYELLSGEAPFAGASPTATMAAQLTRDPDPIESHRPDVPAALSAIITHCLAKDPERRPPNADVLLTELEELASLGFTTPVAAGRPASPRIGVRQAGLLAGGMAALLLVGALLSRQVGRMSEGAMRDSLPSVLAGDSARP